jgi:gluconate 2-dehydrogenase gamma chain
MNISRRDILMGLAALPALSLVASCGLGGAGKAAISKEELSFLSALADTIIPTTAESPGAIAGKVPATLADVLNVWASPETRGRWSTSLAGLQKELDEGNAGSFEKANAEDRTKRLGKLDAAVFAANEHPLKAYREVKSTIATAYYMSEPGATQDLRYSEVPGVFKGSAPVGKTWAT